MRKLGDKIGSKLIAEEVGVPVAPWSRGGVDDPRRRRSRAAERIGYPLMLKATAGGGGRGIRMVDDRRRADRRLRAHPRRGRSAPSAPASCSWSAGHRRPARRGAGHRRRPGHRLGARRPRLLGAAAQPEGHRGVRLPGARRRAGRRARRRPPSGSRSPSTTAAPAPSSSSTTPATGLFAFLEVNTRLQVEHPITEVDHRHRPRQGCSCTSPRAAGSTGDRPAEAGHAVEARLNAEDPDRDFAPAPGRIARLRPARRPRHPGRHRRRRGRLDPRRLRLDDRQDHRLRPRPATRRWPACAARWRETTVVIEGGTTNKSFLLDLLDQPEVIDGDGADTGWIDRVRARGRPRRRTGTPASRWSPPAIEAYEEAEAVETRTGCSTTAHGGRPQAQHEVGRAARPQAARRRPTASTRRPDRRRAATASIARTASDRRRRRSSASTTYTAGSTVGGAPVPARHRAPTARSTWSRSTASPTGSAATRAACVRSPAPALVVATPVAVGDEVEAGAPVARARVA